MLNQKNKPIKLQLCSQSIYRRLPFNPVLIKISDLILYKSNLSINVKTLPIKSMAGKIFFCMDEFVSSPLILLLCFRCFTCWFHIHIYWTEHIKYFLFSNFRAYEHQNWYYNYSNSKKYWQNYWKNKQDGQFFWWISEKNQTRNQRKN